MFQYTHDLAANEIAFSCRNSFIEISSFITYGFLIDFSNKLSNSRHHLVSIPTLKKESTLRAISLITEMSMRHLLEAP
jgi:hypothetical protein